MTVSLLLVYILIGWFEWFYLKQRKRKRRTYRIVMTFLVISLLYNLSFAYFDHVSYINPILTKIFKPVQDAILMKKGGEK